ncbi:MAG: hypothetical protein EOP88_02990 [Verrucomicrobiaceae bacterium]|nr:MAG: hypothetical protein EOP88_02990 [Verrucomicrobiaceae bacterium]
MNPYQSPEHPSEAVPPHDTPFSGDPEEHPLYDMIHRMVIWGEDKAEVHKRMEVNGVTGLAADSLYQHAWNDRIRSIRKEQSGKLFLGIGLTVAAVGTFCFCWFVLHFIPRILLYVCIVALAIGSWKLIDGLAGYLMAENKKGPLHDE